MRQLTSYVNILMIFVLSFLSYDFPYILFRIYIWALWWPLYNSYSFLFKKTLYSFSFVARRADFA